MAGGVTYDGVQSADGGTRGFIFKDMVFWVSHRVPRRNEILELIKNNGGVVVPLEKDAQMLIADHARKDSPPDSISWKYITESVCNGIAQLTDRYRIAPSSNAANSAPKKLTRSAFTDAEDAALVNWVLSETKGQSKHCSGNTMYQKFAETHTSHTWQSWRSRFTQVLANRPIYELEKLAMSAADLAVQPSSASTTPQASPAIAQPRSSRRLAPVSDHTAKEAPIVSDTRKERQSRSPPSSPVQSEEVGIETQVNVRDRFHNDLLIFVEVSGAKLNLEPDVGGRSLDLWDLSQAVASQKVPPDEVDWMKVAKDLDYDWVQDKNVLVELQSCFEDNLADFFDTISSFNSDDDEEQEVESQTDERSPPSVISSSPPVGYSKRKGSLDHQPSSMVENSAKRMRPNPTAEIPSTPEERLKTPATRSNSGATPSQQVHSEAPTVSPIPLRLEHSRTIGGQQQFDTSKLVQESAAQSMTTSRAVKRSLPASFHPSSRRVSAQEAETRAPQPPRPIRAEPDEEGQSQSLRGWIEYYEGLGYSRPIVMESLTRASMRPGWPACYLMELLKEKEEVPSNIEGLWTDRDDKSLRYVDSIYAKWEKAETRERNKAKRELDGLVNKHTMEEVDLRRRFFASQARER
ncbi:hypothetical protein EsDP_00004136 [Epichloe bromicola]|uniref:DNA-binding protein RAP1 n=1 Tax=Epichloe bromicola TaxID=79588 RepID=A0ABQ0CQT9_9HYPO